MAAGNARLEDYRAGALRHGPETVHIDLANACNLNCIGCWNHSPLLERPRPAEWQRQKADAGRVRALLADLRELETERVIFSGSGDPSTHPELLDLIACASRLGLKTTLISNLGLLDPGELLAAGVTTLLVNVWAGTAETYAATHPNQRPEAFGRLAEKLRALRPRNVALVNVICRQNCHELVEMVEFAASVGARRIQLKVASTGEGTEAVALGPAERAQVLAQADAVARRLKETGVGANLELFLSQVRAPEEADAPTGVPGCYAGWFYSRIYVDGRVFLCCKHETLVGDITRQSFREIWFGDAYQAMRARVRARRFFPCCVQCGNRDLNANVHRRLAEGNG